MSSEPIIESSEVPLEVCGMSYRFRMKWNIPIESFVTKNDSKKEVVLDTCSLRSIKHFKDSALSLELFNDGKGKYYKFFIRIKDDKALGMHHDLAYAFVFLDEKLCFLKHPSNTAFSSSHDLQDYHISMMSKKTGASKVKTITVHCAISVGVAGSALMDGVTQKTAKDSSSDGCSSPFNFNIQCFKFISMYFFEGVVPTVTVENAHKVLEGIHTFKLNELEPFVVKQLQQLLSKETAVKIMRIAIDNKLSHLQKESMFCIERYFQ